MKDYLALAGTLLLFCLGGVVTLNCAPDVSIPSGRLDGEQAGVCAGVSGGIFFDIGEGGGVDQARLILPAQLSVSTQEEPINVDWMSTDSNKANVIGGNIALIFKDETRRTVPYTVDFVPTEESKGNLPKDAFVRYRVTVTNTFGLLGEDCR